MEAQSITAHSSSARDGSSSSPRGSIATILIARAAELARAGQYDAAEELLLAVGEHESELDEQVLDLQVLDLLARIRAQQGRYRDAIRLWEQAARAVGASSTYAAERRRASAKWPVAQRPLGMGIVLGVVVLVGLIFTITRRPRTQARSTDISSSAPLASLPAPTVSRPRLTVSLPAPTGLRATYAADAVTVVPDSGLFSDGVQFTRRGESQLVALGQVLRPLVDSIDVEVLGFTDGIPIRSGSPFQSNDDLALRRAGAVSMRLAALSGLPLTAFELRVGQDQFRPAGYDSQHEERRDRTAVIRIRRR